MIEAAETLNKIQVYRAKSELLDQDTRKQVDRLARDHYDPLFGFLRDCLDDKNPGWREKALRKIHYFKDLITEEVLTKIQNIALEPV